MTGPKDKRTREEAQHIADLMNDWRRSPDEGTFAKVRAIREEQQKLVGRSTRPAPSPAEILRGLLGNATRVRVAVALALLEWSEATGREHGPVEWSDVVDRFKATHQNASAEKGLDSKWTFALGDQRVTQDSARQTLLRRVREALETARKRA